MSPIRPVIHPHEEIPLLELPVQYVAMDIEIVDLTDPVYNCIDLTVNEIIYID